MNTIMKEERFWQEGMDGKRLALCLFRRIWLLPLAGVAGAILAAGIYLLHALVFSGPAKYQVFSQYRIWFDSEKYGEIQDYYNAYTWGEIMRTDQVLDYVMEALPETVSKEQVKAAVSVGQMNDIRLMPLYVVTQDGALSESIAQAYRVGLPRFAEALEGLTGMECWQMDPVAAVPRASRTAHAGLAGFFLGAAAAFFGLLLYGCLDDAIYLEEDLAGKYAWPVFGTVTRKGERRLLEELKTSQAYCLEGKEEIWLTGPDVQEGRRALEEVWKDGAEGIHQAPWPLHPEEAERLRKNGVILLLPWGSVKESQVRHMALQLEKQGIEILGAVIYGASDGFLRAYYGWKRK